MSTKKNRILLSMLVVGALGSLAALGVFGLFSATTQNSGNEVTTGTVSFSDNDSGSALYNMIGARPGDTVSRCIKTTYTGSLPAVVHLYTNSAPGELAPYVNVTITQGTQATSVFPSCTGFTPDSNGLIYTGTLSSFEQTRSSYATGISTQPAGLPAWQPGSSIVYQITATLDPATPDAGQGASSGSHGFIWEARSQ